MVDNMLAICYIMNVPIESTKNPPLGKQERVFAKIEMRTLYPKNTISNF
jgi:hypothetical protein